MAGIHSGKLGIKITPISQNDPTMGCERPSQMPVGGDLTNMVDVPIMVVEDENGESINIYRHPYFFVPDSVWNFIEEYLYNKDLSGKPLYLDTDPRHIEASNIYENELYKRRSVNG